VSLLRENLEAALAADRPVVVHIHTVKGKGFEPACSGVVLYLGLNNSLTGELALVAFGGGRLWPVDRQWAARAAWSSAAVPGTACNSFPHALYYHLQAPCPRAGATTGHSRH